MGLESLQLSCPIWFQWHRSSTRLVWIRHSYMKNWTFTNFFHWLMGILEQHGRDVCVWNCVWNWKRGTLGGNVHNSRLLCNKELGITLQGLACMAFPFQYGNIFIVLSITLFEMRQISFSPHSFKVLNCTLGYKIQLQLQSCLCEESSTPFHSKQNSPSQPHSLPSWLLFPGRGWK